MHNAHLLRLEFVDSADAYVQKDERGNNTARNVVLCSETLRKRKDLAQTIAASIESHLLTAIAAMRTIVIAFREFRSRIFQKLGGGVSLSLLGPYLLRAAE